MQSEQAEHVAVGPGSRDPCQNAIQTPHPSHHCRHRSDSDESSDRDCPALIEILQRQSTQLSSQSQQVAGHSAVMRGYAAELKNATNRALNMRSFAAADLLHPIEVYEPASDTYAAPNVFPHSIGEFWDLPHGHVSMLHCAYGTNNRQTWSECDTTEGLQSAAGYTASNKVREDSGIGTQQGHLRELARVIGINFRRALVHKEEAERLKAYEGILDILQSD